MVDATDTPPRGVQLIDRSQWRAIAAVAVLAAVALCVALYGLRPRSAALAPSPVVHVAAAPPCPACPPCAACPACPAAPQERHRR